MNEQQIAYRQGGKDALLALLEKLDNEPKSNEGFSYNDHAMDVIRRKLKDIQ
jgi:hypothetical protein